MGQERGHAGNVAARTEAGKRPRIAVSACLLGEAVRWDGGHRLDPWVAARLAAHAELVPLCPEVAIGLGVPRPTIRLEDAGDTVTARVQDGSGRDVAAALARYGDRVARGEPLLCGALLKARSPSCGLQRVPVHRRAARPRAGRGLYAAALAAGRPELPLEESERLADPRRRQAFLAAVWTLHRWWQAMAAGVDRQALAAFHAEHRYLVLAHHAGAFRRLERLAAAAARGCAAGLAAGYLRLLMHALRQPRRAATSARIACQRERDRHRGLPAATIERALERLEAPYPAALEDAFQTA